MYEYFLILAVTMASGQTCVSRYEATDSTKVVKIRTWDECNKRAAEQQKVFDISIREGSSVVKEARVYCERKRVPEKPRNRSTKK